eukprot:6380553-Pyramimonas_sp.AAC.1
MDEGHFFRLRSSQGHALLDIESFYDEIEWPILVERALECNCPAITHCLELQVCAGPRPCVRYAVRQVHDERDHGEIDDLPPARISNMVDRRPVADGGGFSTACGP